MSLFQSNLRKQIRNLPKILNFVKIIQYYSKLFTGVLTAVADHGRHVVVARRHVRIRRMLKEQAEPCTRDIQSRGFFRKKPGISSRFSRMPFWKKSDFRDGYRFFFAEFQAALRNSFEFRGVSLEFGQTIANINFVSRNSHDHSFCIENADGMIM